MRRAELEHAIRAATEIITQCEVIVIGSQAILASYTEDQLPEHATQSIEVDIAPLNDDDAASLATAPGGRAGGVVAVPFHPRLQCAGRRSGHGDPSDWLGNRLVRVSGANTGGPVGLCLDPHDLCLAKLAAYREKDVIFVGSLIDAGLVDPSILIDRLDDMETADPRAARQYLQRYLS